MRLGRSSLLRLTWAELRRRKVTRVGAIYAIVAWVVLQLAEITFEPLGLPDRALTWTILVAVLGFPVALVLAWCFDVSPRGIVRDRGVGAAAGRLFAVVVVLLTVGGLGWWLTEVYRDDDTDVPSIPLAVAGQTAAAPANAIAVLPFEDMSPGRDHSHLAEGIAEELLDRLARLRGLRVAARTSSFALRGSAGGVTEIARVLGVRWVVDGSVRRSQGRVRVTAQLIDANDGYQVWSDTYEHDGEDLFALQDAVSADIAAQLGRRVGGVEGRTQGEMGTRDAMALDLYLQGRQAWRQRRPATLAQAERLFGEAVERDPEYARAWSGLADTYLLQADYGIRPGHEAIALAEPAAVRAITLDPGLGEAWASVGLLRSQAGQLGPARRSLEEATRLDPRYEMAWMWLAGVHGESGQRETQREVLEQAQQLNPLEPVINVNLASVMAEMGEIDAARALLERVLAITPDDPLLLRTLATTELNTGDFARARELAERAWRADPEAPTSVSTLARVYATVEDYAAAERLLATLPVDNPFVAMQVQNLRLQQGDPRLLPGLEARAEALLAPGQGGSGPDRDVLLVAALSALMQDQPARAADFLAVIVPEPARLRAEPNLLDPASLLVHALRASNRDAEADRLDAALMAAIDPWLAQAGDHADSRFVRAMVALHAGDNDTAVDLLEAAYERGFRRRWLMRHDVRLAPLHGHPRYEALYARIGEDLAAAR